MSLAKSALITLAVALGALLLSFPIFHATLPACDPAQSATQCGLASFLAVLYSLATALAAALAVILYFVLQHVRTRTKIDPTP
jgi:hypothetical protein